MKVINSFALSQCLLEDLSPFIVHENAPEENVKSFAARQLRDNLTKKLVTEVADDADAKALDKFLSINVDCGNWERKYETLQDELLMGHLRDVLYKFVHARSLGGYVRGEWNPVLSNFGQILDHCDLGPGTSIGSDSNDFYTKLFSSKLSSTNAGLYRVYTNHIRNHQSWHLAEETRRVIHGDSVLVAGNRLSFVPKSNEISRVICVEPVLNMLFQQGMKTLLEIRLKSFFGIDLERQQMKNRELARIGSERNVRTDFNSLDNRLVTIDLSSASDSLSQRMLDDVFPPQFLAMLRFARSPVTRLPNGEELQLNMISTMGNAFTFPLQTILFSAVVVAAHLVADVPIDYPFGEKIGNFGVNGDDIICLDIVAQKVLRLLQLLGFKVNDDKTFLEGPFRESCGADFHNGISVRPVFAKKLDTPQDLYSLINRLNLWSYVTGIPLRKTQGYLRRRVPLLEVPPWETADCGIWIPKLEMVRRYMLDSNGTISYKRWVPRPRRIVISNHAEVIHVPRGSKPISYNASGLLIAFLKGHITSGVMKIGRDKTVPYNFMTVRSDSTHYVTKVGKAPSWETSPTMVNPFKDSPGGPDLERLACCTF